MKGVILFFIDINTINILNYLDQFYCELPFFRYLSKKTNIVSFEVI